MGEPVRYIERTARYYAALGYPRPYRWARHDETPFRAPGRPAAHSTLALITTAAPTRSGAGEQGPGSPYNGAAKFHRVYSLPVDPPPELNLSHVAYDRDHARPEDRESFLPLRALRGAVERGELGGLAPRLHGLPSARSQRATLDLHAPDVVARVREDHADLALLVPS